MDGEREVGERATCLGGRGRAIALAVAFLCVAAPTAHALPDVGEEQGGIADTPHSPRAKDPPSTVSFTQVAGARWQEGVDEPTNAQLVEGSPTSVDVTFHAVAAPDEDTALAGGTIEREGELRPTLYRYTRLDGWQPDVTFSGQGFIAAIAWLDDKRALAVGGDGIYPERERDDGTSICDPTGIPPEGDQAGSARAFLYTEGEGWRELRQLPDANPQDELPDAMSALTAAAAYLLAPPAHGQPEPPAFALVGGMCQIWHWVDAGFERGAAGWKLPNRMASGQAAPSYRIRDITFAEPSADPIAPLDPADRRPRAYAATSGCCRDGRIDPVGALSGNPEILTYTVPIGKQPHEGAWAKQTAATEPRLRRPDTHFSVTATQIGIQSPGSPAPGQPLVTGPHTVTSAGGSYDEKEPASHVAGRSAGTVSSVWLSDGDGDIGGTAPRSNYFVGRQETWENPLFSGEVPPWAIPGSRSPPQQINIGGSDLTPTSDGIPDWVVGVQTESGRAVAYGTDHNQLPPPDQPVDHIAIASCPGHGDGMQALISGSVPIECRASTTLTPFGKALDGEPPARHGSLNAAAQSNRLIALSSYGLQAIDVIDEDGIGWAVGKHGSILRFERDAEAIRKRQVQPERGGSKAPAAALPERGPWAGLRSSLPAEPGLVPPLSQRPLLKLDDPKLVPSAGPVPTVASEDRRYAWSLRKRQLPNGQQVWEVKAYLDGGIWHSCADRLEGDPPLHPACESYRSLRDNGIELSGSAVPALVPMRTDGDPTNDYEFELVALSTSSAFPIVRFRDGLWGFENQDALGDLRGASLAGDQHTATSVAFTRPDNGLVTIGGRIPWPNKVRQYAFDGSRWSDCTNACDPANLFRSEASIALSVAGNTMFAYGGIDNTGQINGGVRQKVFPYILVRPDGALGWSVDEPGAYYPLREPDLQQVGNSSLTNAVGSADATGHIDRLMIARSPGGRLEGLALGTFQVGGLSVLSSNQGGASVDLLRLGEDGAWTPERSEGALLDDRQGQSVSAAVVTSGPEPRQFVTLPFTNTYPGAGPSPKPSRIYRFDDVRKRWTIEASNAGTNLTADSEGGFYTEDGPYVRHYTDHPPTPVFTEVARPALPPAASGSRIMQIAAVADGTVWAATDSDQLLRYERALGWDRVRIPGWDPGRIVTNPSPAFALAVSPQGSGLVVGRGGRIARVAPEQVQLDPASGNACDPRAPTPPCGAVSDLRAVAVASDGSAVIGGAERALLWRPSGGELRAIRPPSVPSNTVLTSVAIADESLLWVVADDRVYRGERVGESWRWKLENEGRDGGLMPIDRIAVDVHGHGYGIGGANIFERVANAEPHWRMVRNPTQEALTSIALPAGGDDGALIGGTQGLILTLTPSGFQVARPAESPTRGPQIAPVISTALAPGIEGGQVEAWAVTGNPSGGLVVGDLLPGKDPFAAAVTDTGLLLHFASDPTEPLLNPDRGLTPLPDASSTDPGELTVAAFGKSDCQVTGNEICTEMAGSEEYADRVVSAVVDELEDRAADGDLDFALWTGDAVDEGSYPGHQLAESAAGASTGSIPGTATGGMGLRKLRRWGELVPDRLIDGGVPTFGTPGGRDLSGVVDCSYSVVAGVPEWESCKHRKETRAGENFGWRAAMAERSAPWGSSGNLQGEGLLFERVADGGLSLEHEDQAVEISLSVAGETSSTIAAGGAPTHYAIDVFDTESEEGSATARLVFADTSQGSLAASDPLQQPFEPDGQVAWLERVLCFSPQRTPGGERCTREPGQRAIVVTNTPTYSYGPGALRDTQPDLGVAFESILMRYDVDVVVSGRIGWNGRYWALAPGVHYPCPGASYTDQPPGGKVGGCGQSEPGPAGSATLPDPNKLSGGAGGAGGIGDPLPFVVASGAGGKFGDGQGASQGDTADGFWHGYTVIRLDPEGEREPIVEQRPVYDWAGIEASDRILTARERLTLRGFGRGPVGYNERGSNFPAVPLTRYDRIDSAAVTHRYELLAADPARPWIPKTSAEGVCAPYACLPENVATVDRITGEVRAGNGKYPDTFAIATLSVGDHVASYPLLFRRSPSFIAPPAVRLASLPSPPANSSAAPAPPAPPNPPTPNVPQASVPAPPPVPPIAPLEAAEPPEPLPPEPPAPPPPSEAPAPLSLALAPPGIAIATPTAVIQPPTPPVNPAPPGGARREARQRQAATQKSGADSDATDGVGELGGDRVDSPNSPGTAFTRYESSFVRYPRGRPEPSFSALRHDSAAASGQALLYGTGITFLALAASLGFTHGRPTPRQRMPEAPAPAWSRVGSRRR